MTFESFDLAEEHWWLTDLMTCLSVHTFHLRKGKKEKLAVWDSSYVSLLKPSNNQHGRGNHHTIASSGFVFLGFDLTTISHTDLQYSRRLQMKGALSLIFSLNLKEVSSSLCIYLFYSKSDGVGVQQKSCVQVHEWWAHSYPCFPVPCFFFWI